MAAAKFKRRVLGTGGARFGGGSNYVDFNSAGYKTNVGTARILKEIWIPATLLNVGGAASNYSTTGSPLMQVPGPGASSGRFYIPTISPSSTTCDAQFDFALVAPLDLDTAGSPYLIVEHILTAAFATASQIGYRVSYNYVTTGSNTTSGSFTNNIGSGAACDAGARISGSLPVFPTPAAVGQFMHFHMRMLTGACSSGSLADVAGVRFVYTSNKDGTQVS